MPRADVDVFYSTNKPAFAYPLGGEVPADASAVAADDGTGTVSVDATPIGSEITSGAGAVIAQTAVYGNSLTGVQRPPTSGPYGYNTWEAGSPGFMAVGETYVDPVFNYPIMRVTNSDGGTFDSDNYAKHHANSDGTMLFIEKNTMSIGDTSDASILYVNQPTGIAKFECHWDALDPDKYYYFSGSSLWRRNLAAQTNTEIKDFGTTLQTNGGSLNIQTADGRYFTVRYGGTNKVWDSQTDTVYSGSVAPDGAGGWVSITPNGSHICTGANQHTSYAIDHGTQSISGTGIEYWNLCGDHMVLCSASDGNSYAVGAACTNNPEIYAIDVTTDVSSMTENQQLAAATLLIDRDWDDDIHLSAVSKGIYQDWVFIDYENLAGGDNFNSTPGAGWPEYEAEIVAVNCLTGAQKRLCHHRSRSISTSYYAQPRVSCAWDGSVVIWISNFNDNSPSDYTDMYLIPNPLD